MEIFRSHNDHFYDDVQLGLMYEMLPNDKKESYQTYDEWVISLCEMGERNSRLTRRNRLQKMDISIFMIDLQD